MKKSPLTFVPRGSSVDRSPESKRGSSVDRPRGEGEENFDNPLLSQLKKGLSVDRLTSQKSEGEEESKGNFEAAINPHPSSATREPSSSLDRIPSQESDSSKKGSSKKSLTDLESELKEKKKFLESKNKNSDQQQQLKIKAALRASIPSLEKMIEAHPEVRIKECVEKLSSCSRQISILDQSEIEDDLVVSINESAGELSDIKKDSNSNFEKILLRLNPDLLGSFSFLSARILEDKEFFSKLSESAKDLIKDAHVLIEKKAEAKANSTSRNEQSRQLDEILRIRDESFKGQLQSFLETASKPENLERVGQKYDTIEAFQSSNHYKKIEAIVERCVANKDKALEGDVKKYLEEVKKSCEDTEREHQGILKSALSSAKGFARIFVQKEEPRTVVAAKRESLAIAKPALMSFKNDPDFLNQLNGKGIIDRGFFMKIFSEIALVDGYDYGRLSEPFVDQAYTKFCKDLSRLLDQKSLNRQLPNYSEKKGTEVFLEYFEKERGLLNMSSESFDRLSVESKRKEGRYFSSDKIVDLSGDLIEANAKHKNADKFVSGAIALIEVNLGLASASRSLEVSRLASLGGGALGGGGTKKTSR